MAASAGQRAAGAPLVQAFLGGLGDKASTILSAYMDRAAGGLIELVQTEQRRVVARPSYAEVVRVEAFAPTRLARERTSADRYGHFAKGVAYTDWKRGMHSQAWFDSAPERTLANLLDDAEEIRGWVRLQRGDVPILWHGAGDNYNPDFLAVDNDGVHWVLEVKAERDMAVADVVAKRQAAIRWANHVSADGAVAVPWRYALFSESMILSATESWGALRQLAGS